MRLKDLPVVKSRGRSLFNSRRNVTAISLFKLVELTRLMKDPSFFPR